MRTAEMQRRSGSREEASGSVGEQRFMREGCSEGAEGKQPGLL